MNLRDCTIQIQVFRKKVLAPADCFAYNTYLHADMAQLVEHHLAKVGVAGSNPVVRSMNIRAGLLTSPALFVKWRDGQVVRQRPAKPSPPVRIRFSPPKTRRTASAVLFVCSCACCPNPCRRPSYPRRCPEPESMRACSRASPSHTHPPWSRRYWPPAGTRLPRTRISARSGSARRR